MSGLASSHFPLRHRLIRAAWILAWALLAAWTPPPLHPWRALVLRVFGAKLGRRVRVYGSARIWYPPNLKADDGAVIGGHSVIYCQAPIHVGENAIISQYAHLIAGTHDIDHPDLPLILRSIHIGRGAWVAANAIVGPGVDLGEGAVLGAGGVSFSDVPDWCVFVGNPARYLRRRLASDASTSPLPRAPHETLPPRQHIPHH